MSGNYIYYRSGYKHQLAEDYNICISIKPEDDIDTEFIALDKQGLLLIKKGYAWNGVSGPVIDTEHNLRASLIHDALYQLMRKKELSVKEHKDKADRLFKKICKKDGVADILADIYYQALKKLGKPSTDPKNAKKVMQAPSKN